MFCSTLLHLAACVPALYAVTIFDPKSAGDFNAAASLIDVFVTLHGILSGSNAAMAASFAKKSPAAHALQPQQHYSASSTPAAARHREADSFLSSKSEPLAPPLPPARPPPLPPICTNRPPLLVWRLRRHERRAPLTRPCLCPERLQLRGERTRTAPRTASSIHPACAQVTELSDATPPPHYGKFVADYRTPVEEPRRPKSSVHRNVPSPTRATRLIANAELYNPPFVRHPTALPYFSPPPPSSPHPPTPFPHLFPALAQHSPPLIIRNRLPFA